MDVFAVDQIKCSVFWRNLAPFPRAPSEGNGLIAAGKQMGRGGDTDGGELSVCLCLILSLSVSLFLSLSLRPPSDKLATAPSFISGHYAKDKMSTI